MIDHNLRKRKNNIDPQYTFQSQYNDKIHLNKNMKLALFYTQVLQSNYMVPRFETWFNSLKTGI